MHMHKLDVYMMGFDDGSTRGNGNEPVDRWGVSDELLETYCDGYEDGSKGRTPNPR
jgi:hypothetical protein